MKRIFIILISLFFLIGCKQYDSNEPVLESMFKEISRMVSQKLS